MLCRVPVRRLVLLTRSSTQHGVPNGFKLKQDESFTYLGTRLSNQTRDHIDSRITAARRACYGLQGAGLCVRGANPLTIAHMYKTAIQPILTYGCSTIKLKPNNIDELEKVQASLIKAALGLSKYSRNTPIPRALNIKKIGRILDERHLSLTRAALHNTSKSRTFYLHIMHKCQYQHMNKHCNLLQRSKQICNSKGIMPLKLSICLTNRTHLSVIYCLRTTVQTALK